MSTIPGSTLADLQRQLDERTAERDDALDREAATAEVLQVINSSPGDLAPVFDAILEKAHSLCGAAHGTLMTYDGQLFRAVAVRGLPEPLAERLRQGIRPGPNHPMRPVLDGAPFLHIPDLTKVDQSEVRLAVEYGSRTLLFIPLRKGDALIGQIVAVRQEVRPFSDKQIALLQNFAAQAVIAMENARLLTETREALEQQTATAEVLQVINSSPGDLTPVFDAMLDKATRLCEADFGILLTYEEDHYRAAAFRNVPPAYAAILREPIRPGARTALARIARGEPVAQIADIAADEELVSEPMVRGALELAGFRTVLAVALRKEDTLVGAMTIYRREVRPFSDKQVALLQNFAAQAVIAIENTRLITETREALEQQTATAEVLGVINSSPGDLAPVFDAILEKAHTLCGADHGAMLLRNGEDFQAIASRGLPEAFAEHLRQGFRANEAHLSKQLLAGEPFVQLNATALTGRRIHQTMDAISSRRTLLSVPLRKGDALFGMIVAGRFEDRPFTEKQIALLQNFAAQAVIAMENASLPRRGKLSNSRPRPPRSWASSIRPPGTLSRYSMRSWRRQAHSGVLLNPLRGEPPTADRAVSAE